MTRCAAIPRWRPLRRADLPMVARIAAHVHPSLPERDEVFEEKRHRFPQGCFGLELDRQLVGYALSHPWTLRSIPPLDAFLESLPPSPDCLYLHDVAVLSEARGRGCAAQIVATLSEIGRADGLKFLALVSVHRTEAFWRRMGFQPADADAGLAGKLDAYGPDARYMTRSVQAPSIGAPSSTTHRSTAV